MTKKFFSILLCLLLFVAFVPTTVLAAQPQISAVTATSANVDTIPTLYGSLKIPSFTITQGSPAYITASDANLRWQKNIGGVWTNQDTGRFTPGEWRISASLRLDGDGALQYDFAQNLTFKVNGKSWTVETPNNYGTYSFAWVYSPSFTIVDDPNVQPPVAVESVHMVLNGYTPGAAAASATVSTDANVTVEILGFLEAIDSNGDGEPDATEAVTGNFASGKLYVAGLKIAAKPGYDISELTIETVTLDRALAPMLCQYDDEEEVFVGMYILSDAMQYTVTFETNGGNTVQPVTVGGGTAIKEPAEPTRAYYAFAGWYSDEALTTPFDFENTPITAHTTLYAKWTPSPVGGMFLMTIDLNGGINVMSMPLSGEIPACETMYFTDDIGEFITPPVGKVLAGYEINGMPYDPEIGHLVAENFTLKLLWKNADQAAVGWQLIYGAWYYCDAFGVPVKGWLNDGGTWYYMDWSGAMQTGWVLDGNTWYYMNASGAMQTGWVLDGNTWYYMNASGAMQTGWIHDGIGWYFLNASGAWVQ